MCELDIATKTIAKQAMNEALMYAIYNKANTPNSPRLARERKEVFEGIVSCCSNQAIELVKIQLQAENKDGSMFNLIVMLQEKTMENIRNK